MSRLSLIAIPAFLLLFASFLALTNLPVAIANDERENNAKEEGPSLTFQDVRAYNAGGLSITRAAVPGGWLIHSTKGGGREIAHQMTFVPDAMHRWDAPRELKQSDNHGDAPE